MAVISKPKWYETKHFRETMVKIIAYVVISLGSIIFLLPFFWMISTSLKPSTQVYTFPPEWIPKPVLWSNYVDAWRILPSALFFKNTAIVAILYMIGVIISSSLIAFGFARTRFRGRDILFLVLLSTMMLPGQVTMIPIYLLFSRLGWIDSFKPLIIPGYFGNPFFIFLLRQFFLTIPKELDDAAKIDGCGFLGIYSRVILPLSKPALAIVAVFSFTWTWSDFMGPLIYLNSLNKFTIALGLRAFQTQYAIKFQPLMAMSTVALIPVLVLFFIAQKYLVQGITLTGMKA